jgi:O-antigen/teichoic acid export membrane protein
MVYGEAYRPAVPAAMVLIAFAALSFATIGSSLIYGMEKAWFIAAGGFGGAALSVTACLVVIPRYGVWGAVWSRAGVQTAMVALGLWFISRKLLCAVPLWALTKTLCAASLAALAAYAATTIQGGLAGLGLALIASPLVYALLAALFGLVEAHDKRRLRLALGDLSSFVARAGGSIR